MTKFFNKVPFNRPPFGSAFGNAFGSTFGLEGGFNANAQGNLVLDLDASLGITLNGADVSAWASQSGGQNSIAVQGIAILQPTFNATGLNGEPSVTFIKADETQMGIPSNSDIDITDSFTMYVVANFPAQTGETGTLLSKNVALGYNIGINLSDQIFVECSDGTITGPVNSNAVAVNTDIILEIIYRVTGGGLAVFTANGADEGDDTHTLESIFSNSAQAFVGALDVNDFLFNGDIGRMLLYKGVLPTANRNNVIRGLGQQFGITVSTVSAGELFCGRVEASDIDVPENGGVTLLGITEDDDGNIIYADAGNDTIVRLVGKTAVIDAELDLNSAIPVIGNPWGVAWVNGNLVVTNTINRTVTEFVGFSLTVNSSFTHPHTTASQIRGIAWTGSNLLSIVADAPETVFELQGISDTIVQQFATSTTSARGIAFDGTNMMLGDANTNQIIVYDGISNTEICRFATPATNQTGITVLSDNGLALGDISTSPDKIFFYDPIVT